MKSSILFLAFTFITSTIFSQVIKDIDEIGSSFDGYTTVMKDGKWGIIDTDGNLVVGYRNDLVMSKDKTTPIFKNGMGIIKEIKGGVTYYGCINSKGEKVANTDFLDITDFKDGYAIALKTSSKSRGMSMLGKEIIDNYYDEVVIDTNGKVVKYLYYTKIITLAEGHYKKPEIVSKFISDKLVATKTKEDKWVVYKL